MSYFANVLAGWTGTKDVSLSGEIDETAVFAFRNGGCAALAAAVIALNDAFRMGLIVDLEWDEEGDGHPGPIDEAKHAVVVDMFGRLWDISGEICVEDMEDTGETVEVLDTVEDERWFVDLCPRQDEATVTHYANLVYAMIVGE